jgi:Raf kinase inhibitor-like YbhB/YbcL family protein
LTSEAFASGASIPKEYSCDGRGTSPALAWSGAPATTRAFALIVDDPDAPGGTFVHWVVYDLPATATGLPAAIPPNVALDNGAQQGVGGSRKEGYTGPCPPAGKDHHYSFRLYALDSPLKLSAGKNKGEVERAMDGHVLAVAELVGLYRR